MTDTSTPLVIPPLGIAVYKTFAPLGYLMDPVTEDLLRGSELKDGMVVLIEDRLAREDPDQITDEWTAQSSVIRILATSRWCMVTKLQQGDILSFIGVYGDGTKMSRTYSDRYFWFVKK